MPTNFGQTIFIPQPRLCNGTIRSIEFCYQASNRNSQLQVVFRFFLLTQCRRNPPRCSLNYDMNVDSIPYTGTKGTSTANCTEQGTKLFCCDVKHLCDQVHVSSLNNFAVSTKGGGKGLLRFNDSAPSDYMSSVFNASFMRINGDDTMIMNAMASGEPRRRPLLLLRVLIGMTVL